MVFSKPDRTHFLVFGSELGCLQLLWSNNDAFLAYRNCGVFFVEACFFQNINQPVDHEPVSLEKNEHHHEIQRGRISLETDFECFNAVI